MKCPICREQTTWQDNPYRPFCSERCRLLDLGKWADGEYRISGGPRAQDETGAAADGADSNDKNGEQSDATE